MNPYLLHDQLSNAVILFALVLGIWGLFKYFRGDGVDGSYLGAVVIGEVLIIVQIALGILLYAGGARPDRSLMHILYGVAAVISFPAVYAYTQGDQSRRAMLIWGVVGLFVFGCAMRATMVAG